VKSFELKGRWLGSGIIQRVTKPEAKLCPSFSAMQPGGTMRKRGTNSRWKERKMATVKVEMKRAFWIQPKGLKCLPDLP